VVGGHTAGHLANPMVGGNSLVMAGAGNGDIFDGWIIGLSVGIDCYRGIDDINAARDNYGDGTCAMVNMESREAPD